MKRKQNGPLAVAATSRAKGSATGQGALPAITKPHLWRKCKSPTLVKWALVAYEVGPIPVTTVAQRVGICPATLTGWAKKAGLVLRGRGRRKSGFPTPRVEAFVLAARSMPQADVARKFGISKRAVSRAVTRWAEWHRITTVIGNGFGKSSCFLLALCWSPLTRRITRNTRPSPAGTCSSPGGAERQENL